MVEGGRCITRPVQLQVGRTECLAQPAPLAAHATAWCQEASQRGPHPISKALQHLTASKCLAAPSKVAVDAQVRTGNVVDIDGRLLQVGVAVPLITTI